MVRSLEFARGRGRHCQPLRDAGECGGQGRAQLRILIQCTVDGGRPGIFGILVGDCGDQRRVQRLIRPGDVGRLQRRLHGGRAEGAGLDQRREHGGNRRDVSADGRIRRTRHQIADSGRPGEVLDEGRVGDDRGHGVRAVAAGGRATAGG